MEHDRMNYEIQVSGRGLLSVTAQFLIDQLRKSVLYFVAFSW